MSIRKINLNPTNRVDTGAIQFGDDFPALFIRGDDALQLEFILAKVLNHETLFEHELAVLEKYYLLINREVCQRP